MTSHPRTRDPGQPSRLEAGGFLAGCLLLLLACGGGSAGNLRTAAPASTSPGAADPRLAACDQGSSQSCNQIGEELWQQKAYPEARDWFAVACARMDDLVANGQRLVELGNTARAARQVLEAEQQGALQDPSLAAAARQTIDGLKADSEELEARISACVRVGDTHHMQDDHAAAQPYFEKVCRLKAIQAQVEPLIAGFQEIVGSACVGGEYSRQTATSRAAARAELGALLLQADAGPPRACPDSGKSCETDARVLSWQRQCASNPPTQAPCYCAAVASYQCFIAQGCYAEAGARRADGRPSDTGLAMLQQGLRQNAAIALELGLTCQ